MISVLARIAFGLMLVFCANSTWAEDRGKWLCTECSIDEMSLTIGTEELAFIKYEVNQTVLQWRPNDTVIICDGRNCIPVLYHASGNFLISAFGFPDSRTGYKNFRGSSAGIPQPSYGSSLSALPGVSISGHTESLWVLDHGTGNMYFVESFFVIDAIVLSSSGGDPYTRVVE